MTDEKNGARLSATRQVAWIAAVIVEVFGVIFLALPVNPTEKWDDRHPGDGVSMRVYENSDRYIKWGRSSR